MCSHLLTFMTYMVASVMKLQTDLANEIAGEKGDNHYRIAVIALFIVCKKKKIGYKDDKHVKRIYCRRIHQTDLQNSVRSDTFSVYVLTGGKRDVY